MTNRLATGHHLAIGDHLEQTLYLQPFSRYWPLTALGSQPFDLSGSRDVIGHVTIRFPVSHFLWVLHCQQFSISSRFRDNGHQTYWGHDFDLSGSCDVIGHVIIGLGMGHFLLVVQHTC